MQGVGADVPKSKRGVNDYVEAGLVAPALLQGAEHALIAVSHPDRQGAPAGLGVGIQRHLRDVHVLVALVDVHLQGLTRGDDCAPKLHLHLCRTRSTMSSRAERCGRRR